MVSSVHITVFEDKNEFSVTWEAGRDEGTLATLEKIQNLLSKGLKYVDEPCSGSEDASTSNSLSHAGKNAALSNHQAKLHKTVELIFSRYQSSWTALFDKIFSTIRKFFGWGPSTGEKIASAYGNIKQQLGASLEKLPDALLKQIFGFLPAEQIARCRRISTQFYNAKYEGSPPAPEIQRALAYGYRGDNLQEANAHIRMVLGGVKQLVKLKKKFPWCEELMNLVDCKKTNGHLDCEAMLRKLMVLPLSEQQKKSLNILSFRMTIDTLGIKKKEVASVLLLLGFKPGFFFGNFFQDPISHARMTNPEMIVPCGHSFESAQIKGWIANRVQAGAVPDCPLCRKPIRKLVPNILLKQGLEILDASSNSSAERIEDLTDQEQEDLELAIDHVKKRREANHNANPVIPDRLPQAMTFAREVEFIEYGYC